MTKATADNTPAAVDFGEYDGAGFENIDAAHLKIPFLALLQGLSDEVKPKNEKYVEGAKPGMFMNSVTKELYPEGVEFIPACVDHCFVEWIPRKRGGGFVARHDLDSAAVREGKANAAGSLQLKIQRKDKEGGVSVNDLVETFYVAGIIMTENGPDPIVIAATSTKIGPYKEWMTRVNKFTIPKSGGGKQKPPLFAHQVRISSWDDSNTKGDYSNIKIEPSVDNDFEKSLITDLESVPFLEGKKIRALLGSGQATMDYTSQESTTSAPGSDSDDF